MDNGGGFVLNSVPSVPLTARLARIVLRRVDEAHQRLSAVNCFKEDMTKANIVRAGDGVPVLYRTVRGGFGIRVVHPQTTGSKNLSALMLYLGPGGVMEPHDHENEEIYTILEGEGEGYFGQGKPVKVEPGMFVHMPPHAEHGLKNTGDRMMVVLVCTSPPVPAMDWDTELRPAE